MNYKIYFSSTSLKATSWLSAQLLLPTVSVSPGCKADFIVAPLLLSDVI